MVLDNHRNSVLTNLALVTAEQYNLLGRDGEDSAAILYGGLTALAQVWGLPEEQVLTLKAAIEDIRSASLTSTITGLHGDFQIPSDRNDIVYALTSAAEGRDYDTAHRLLEAARFLASYWSTSIPL